MMQPFTTEKIYAVSELNRLVRGLLENQFTDVQIEGEIANLSKPASGHLYFSLKDDSAQLRCAMFKNRSFGTRYKPQSGDQVIARGKISLYEARGDYQFIIETLQPAGAGALQQAFDLLKEKLFAEGLFDQSRKKQIPAMTKKLAVITSPSGAAIRDILQVLGRRFPLLEVVIYPVPVQGSLSHPAICEALQLADQQHDIDLILLSRGGGSIEDLWSFNEEQVARTIAACDTPTVCGVGHEIDFTIADFVADLRAPTPSAAAEMITPDQGDLKQRLNGYQRSLDIGISTLIQTRRQQLDWLYNRLQQKHPLQIAQQQAQRVDELHSRLESSQRQRLQMFRQQLGLLQNRLVRQSPETKLANLKACYQQLALRFTQSWNNRHQILVARLARLDSQLALLNPQATLQRGYAIVRLEQTGKPVTSTQQLRAGTNLTTQLANGSFVSNVTSTSQTDEVP